MKKQIEKTKTTVLKQLKRNIQINKNESEKTLNTKRKMPLEQFKKINCVQNLSKLDKLNNMTLKKLKIKSKQGLKWLKDIVSIIQNSSPDQIIAKNIIKNIRQYIKIIQSQLNIQYGNQKSLKQTEISKSQRNMVKSKVINNQSPKKKQNLEENFLPKIKRQNNKSTEINYQKNNLSQQKQVKRNQSEHKNKQRYNKASYDILNKQNKYLQKGNQKLVTNRKNTNISYLSRPIINDSIGKTHKIQSKLMDKTLRTNQSSKNYLLDRSIKQKSIFSNKNQQNEQKSNIHKQKGETKQQIIEALKIKLQSHINLINQIYQKLDRYQNKINNKNKMLQLNVNRSININKNISDYNRNDDKKQDQIGILKAQLQERQSQIKSLWTLLNQQSLVYQ